MTKQTKIITDTEATTELRALNSNMTRDELVKRFQCVLDFFYANPDCDWEAKKELKAAYQYANALVEEAIGVAPDNRGQKTSTCLATHQAFLGSSARTAW